MMIDEVATVSAHRKGGRAANRVARTPTLEVIGAIEAYHNAPDTGSPPRPAHGHGVSTPVPAAAHATELPSASGQGSCVDVSRT